MPFQDLINKHVPDSDKELAKTLVSQLETLLQPYLRNLSPKENVSVGKISEKNKLFIDKDRDYHSSQPALDNPDVDWPEFEADYSSRKFYAGLSLRLLALTKGMTETRRLHDHDNFQNARLDYQFAKYKDRTSKGLGFDTKVEELGQFFKGGGSTMPDISEE